MARRIHIRNFYTFIFNNLQLKQLIHPRTWSILTENLNFRLKVNLLNLES